MGVPKFYRWISERYPCLSEVIKEYQMPEFDNLYLDMNGIIHVCSHPNDDNPHFRISEEQIFADIFHYIEVLFRIIKPQKVFFMAVDGVAPRAKMNQQRGRRFRSAREAVQREEEALRKGEVLPTEARFDSNCITPGTAFMVRLQEQLKFFVQTKISTDKMWQGLRIYLSGHETPGEGEHKIMDFIRYEKSTPDYDPNTRHCLYGLDADLIMLGLCSHEPHFSLLREEVRFGNRKNQKRISSVDQTTFHLLHLSLMREYLEHEFQSLKGQLSFEYNVENIIDDWVLMGFLVGNDFIPHLPNLHIAHDALPTIYQTYMEVLPTLDGYLNEGGCLNLARFEKFMALLGRLDYDKFEEKYDDLKWLENKAAGKHIKQSKRQKNVFEGENFFGTLDKLNSSMDDVNFSTSSTDDSDEDSMGNLKDLVASTMDCDSIDDDEMFEIEFRTMKRDYYMSKLNFECTTPEVLLDQALGYVRAIQWILHYYYNGVASWSWYYPHHYAPYISDIKDFSSHPVELEMSKPFLPYEQLLAVLPSLSKDLLPKAYQNLMTEEHSPLIQYYPNDFKTDLNGKNQEWEAVVLVPFINEELLISAMKLYEPNLTIAEKDRNKHGPCHLYTYSPDHTGCVKSKLQHRFPDISFNHAVYTEIPQDYYRLEPSKIKKGLLEGVKVDVYYHGFPTLKHISHTASTCKANVNVFQTPSRKESVILKVPYEDKDPLECAENLLGREVYVAWPHMIEARVSTIMTESKKYSMSKNGDLVIEDSQDLKDIKKLFKAQNLDIYNKYMNRLGISLGHASAIVHAQPMIGRKYIFSTNGRISLEKQWSDITQAYPIQTLMKEIAVYDPDLKPYSTIEEVFPPTSTVFVVGSPHYGAKGEVVEVDKQSKYKIKAKVTVNIEPDLSPVIKMQTQLANHYFPGFAVAQKLGISSHLVSRLTGSVLIIPTPRAHHIEKSNSNYINIGLNLKFNKKNQEIPGYTKKSDGTWTYSYKAIDVMREYVQKFPDLWESMAGIMGSDIFYLEDLYPAENRREKLQEIQDYLKTLPCANIERQQCGSKMLDHSIIKALEDVADEASKLSSVRQKIATIVVKPSDLYQPTNKRLVCPPDQSVVFKLFDRVVNVREGYKIPVGLHGTIIGLHSGENKSDSIYDVLFDSEFMGATSINSSSNRAAKVPDTAIINISHGTRKYASPNQSRAKEDRFYKSSKSFAQASNGNRQNNVTNMEFNRNLGINHSPTAPFQPQMHNNNSKSVITPKKKSSIVEAPIGKSAKAHTKPLSQQPKAQAGNSGDFLNIWESLKNKDLTNSTSGSVGKNKKEDKVKVSLSQAAKSLPKMDKSIDKKLITKDKSSTSKVDKTSTPKFKAEKKQDNQLKFFEDQCNAAFKELLHIDDEKKSRFPEENQKISVEQLFKEAESLNKKESSPKAAAPPAQQGSVTQLLNVLQSHNMRMQMSHQTTNNGMIYAEIKLPDGSRFYSPPSEDNQRASESAAAQALVYMMQPDSPLFRPPMKMFGQPNQRIQMPPNRPNGPRGYRPLMSPFSCSVPPQYSNQMFRPPAPMMHRPPFHNQQRYNNGVSFLYPNQAPRFEPPPPNQRQKHASDPSKQISNNHSSTSGPSAVNAQASLNLHAMPFVPLQVTKQQTPRKRTSSEQQESNDEEAHNDLRATPESSPNSDVKVTNQEKKITKTPRSRLACNFSNV